jgi:2-alkyl-3-oxoalkanoate reductase
MQRIAIVGASGFIGVRLVETFHLAGLALPRPVVSSPASIARVSRFDLDTRVADALDEGALHLAFAGCDVVVHVVAGNPQVIRRSIQPVCRAAVRAGVGRLVYLSSAAVHGQAPAPGTTEASPLLDRQPLAYNNAKVAAERMLHAVRSQGNLEVVILRPGIVFGPRSQWVGGFADALLNGHAYLIDGGRGICNSIYVDNLVHAVARAAAADGVDGEAFLVGDEETVTWRDLYLPIARALGVSLDEVPHVEPVTRNAWREKLEEVQFSPTGTRLRSVFPKRLRRAVSSGVEAFMGPAPAISAWSRVTPPVPRATLEMSLLSACRYKPPHDKARRLLGYEPIVTFAEGGRRTVEWLRFAGYPVHDNPASPE